MNPIACCFGRQRKRDESPTYNEKSSLIAAERAPRTESEVATDVVNVLLNAEKPGKTLSNALDDTVKGCSWTSRLAEAILGKLEAALKAGAQMSQVMKDAVEKATAEAYDFAKEHPVYCTIIALGVLCLLWPWALEALGFGEAGIMEGKLRIKRLWTVQ